MFCVAGKLKKNLVKKSVFGPFLESFDQKSVFFSARAPPSTLEQIVAQGKIVGSLTQKRYISKIVQRGDPLGRHGVESLRGKGVRPRPLKTPLLHSIKNIIGST